MLYGIEQPFSGHTVTDHTITGQQTTEIDPLNRATDRFYDASGHLTDVWLPAVADALNGNASTRPHWHYTYDAEGDELTQVDPKGHTTSFTYDDHGRRLSRTLPPDSDGNTANDTETWSYDAHGRLDVHTDFAGHATKEVYDPSSSFGGRMDHEERYTAGTGSTLQEKTVFGYDDLGRQRTVTEFANADMTNAARSTTYEYDPITGNQSEVASPEGTIDYEYDAATGKLKRTYTASNDERYDYDPLGRLFHVTSYVLNGVTLTSSNATKYTYDADGNLDTETQPNGVYTDYDYDALNRLKHLTVKKSASGNRLFEQDYALLEDGQRDYVIEKRYDGTSSNPTSKVKIDWTYDALNHLTGEQRTTDPTPANGTDDFGTQSGTDYADTFTFDLAGNRHSKVHDAADNSKDETVTSGYNDRDQLISENSSNDANDSTTTYDANGNTISVTTGPSGSQTIKRYVWDLRNRMTGYNANGNVDSNGKDILTDTGERKGDTHL